MPQSHIIDILEQIITLYEKDRSQFKELSRIAFILSEIPNLDNDIRSFCIDASFAFNGSTSYSSGPMYIDELKEEFIWLKNKYMIGKPIYLNKAIYELLLKNVDESKLSDAMENPSPYLLKECDIFKTPELLLDVIFDIDDLEFLFIDASITAIKNGDTVIPVKRVIDHQLKEVVMTEIVKAFQQGCVIDCKS